MGITNLETLSDRELEILVLIAGGASDKEVAHKLYLSINTVKWHNRQIYQKLGVSSRTEALVVAADRKLLEKEEIQNDPAPKKYLHNLPTQISSFIGRENEIQQIKGLLKTTRLLTLTGPGGVGKTRLAQEVSGRLITENGFTDGIFFVDLASLTSPDRIVDAIVDALNLILQPGQKAMTVLEGYLDTKKILLVMDNYEHLLDAAPLVGDLLSTTSYLKVLVTSREALKSSWRADLSGIPTDFSRQN